jgi:hypothetical protein
MTCKDVAIVRLRQVLREKSQTRLIDTNHEGGLQNRS